MIENPEDDILVWGTSQDDPEEKEVKATDDSYDNNEKNLSKENSSLESYDEDHVVLEETSEDIDVDASVYEKKYYKISEVESILGETQSTIRFWEDAFSCLGKNFCSQRSRGGTRKFTKVNIENLKLLKLLLREQRLTIEGAISEIKKEKRRNAKDRALILLQETKDELNDLIDAYNLILHQNCQ